MGTRAGQSSGFTLLEMLFVMFIVGLMVSLALPRFAANMKQREAATQRDDVEDQLRELPRRVRLSAHPLKLPDDLKLTDLGDGAAPLRLAAGWTLNFEPALEISVMGVCSKAKVVLQSTDDPSLSTRYQIAPISCELSLASS